jgi:hypothetical protein
VVGADWIPEGNRSDTSCAWCELASLADERMRVLYLIANTRGLSIGGDLVRFGHAVAICHGVTALSGENEIQRPNGT